MGTEINWFEIYVLDLDRAEAFYKKIFNASFFEMIDYPCEARGITLNETPESMEGSGKNLPFSSLSEDLKKKEEEKE